MFIGSVTIHEVEGSWKSLVILTDKQSTPDAENIDKQEEALQPCSSMYSDSCPEELPVLPHLHIAVTFLCNKCLRVYDYSLF